MHNIENMTFSLKLINGITFADAFISASIVCCCCIADIFTAWAAMLARYAVVILSVCLSVRHTRPLWQNQTMHCRYFDTKRKGNHSSFLTPTLVGGWRPFRLKFALKMTHPFEKRRLRHISAYNRYCHCLFFSVHCKVAFCQLFTNKRIWWYDVSAVRDSEKSSIMTNRKSTTGFPMSYRCNAYVTPKSPKGWLKKRFFV